MLVEISKSMRLLSWDSCVVTISSRLMIFYDLSELWLEVLVLGSDISFPSLINSLAGVSFSLIALSDMVVGAKIGLLSSS